MKEKIVGFSSILSPKPQESPSLHQLIFTTSLPMVLARFQVLLGLVRLRQGEGVFDTQLE